MNTPNLPHPDTPLIRKDGKMHDAWYRFFNQWTNECQKNLSEEGLNIPKQTQSKINTLQGANPLPSFVYDKDNKVAKVAIEGVYKTVMTS